MEYELATALALQEYPALELEDEAAPEDELGEADADELDEPHPPCPP